MDPHEATAVPGAAQGSASALSLPLVHINLDEDTSRRGAMEAALSDASVYAERFPAIRWTRLHVDQQTQLYSTELNIRTGFRPLADGETGCYASHIGAWRQLLSRLPLHEWCWKTMSP